MIESGTLLLNRYEILKPIGKGGMGAVYLARDQRLGNTIALKETFFTDALMLAAFEREARLLAGLRHPALPKVIDHFADDNGQYLVMEFISGDDLQELLAATKAAFSTAEVLQWADQILDALDYLHSQIPAIIHRDIKPQNLKLTSRNQVVLLDFGLAKSESANTTTTNSGQSIFAYTPSYAPLEQIQGSGTDAQSDLYSVGATLYHLLTGSKPIDALTRATAVLNGQTDPLPSASQKNPQIPPDVSDVLAQAMALNRERRPLTALVMRRMLRNATPAIPGSQVTNEQTILTQSGSSTAAKAGLLVSEQVNVGLNPKATPASPTHPEPAAKQTQSCPPAQTRSSATPTWPTPPTPAMGNGLSRNQFIALAVVLLAAISVLLYSQKRQPDRQQEQTGQTTQSVLEPEKVATQTGHSPSPAATTTQVQNPTPAPIVPSEPVASQENRSQTESEPAPKVGKVEAAENPQKTQPAEGKREPERPIPSESQPVAPDPRRDPERRPPPPGAYPPPPFPPPPHGMPPPDRRRP